MYKLIIVDDDAGTSNSLGNYFPWEEHGFQVIDKFYDGQAAWQFLQANPVDLIISDIKMPVMDGIELARLLWEQKRREIIVFISGFKDFEYARKAMAYGVKYYFLKPATYSEIKTQLAVIKKQLDEMSIAADRPESGDDGIRTRQINKIKAYIQENYRTATLESAADFIQMNPCYLSRFFKEYTGENLSCYTTRVRMKQALAFLQDDKYRNIYEVCELVGYSNAVSFAKTFTKIYGVTPTAYRQRFSSIQADRRQP